MSPPPVAAEKCQNCLNSVAPSYWLGCLTCEDYWICYDCAADMIPMTGGGRGKRSLDREVIEGTGCNWQIVCNKCRFFFDKNKNIRTSAVTDSGPPFLEDLTSTVKELANSVNSIQEELRQMQQKAPKTYADAIRKDLSKDVSKAVANFEPRTKEDMHKTRVVVTGLEETGTLAKDWKQAQKLLTDLDLDITVLCAVERMGRQYNGKPRLTKLTLRSEFDTRLLLGAFKESELPNYYEGLRMRPSLPLEVRKRASATYKLNQDLKRKYGEEQKVSYSLRDSGEVWKFTQLSSGKWVRDSNFVFDETLLNTEN